MKNFRKNLSLLLCLTLVLNFTLPNFATGKDTYESSGDEYTTSSSFFDFGENDCANNIVEEEKNNLENLKDKEGDGTSTSDNQGDTEKEENGDDESTKSSSEENDNANDEDTTSDTKNNNDDSTNKNEDESNNNNIKTTTETTTTVANSNEDEDISTPSEATSFEEETEDEKEIATASDANEKTPSKGAEKDDYAKLNTLDQFNYLVEDSAKLVDNTIVLMKDVTLFDAVRFTDNKNLDMNGFSITGPMDNYTLYIENNFTLTDSTVKNEEGDDNLDAIKSSIKSVTRAFPVIYAKNAELNLGKTKITAIDGVNGGDAIHLYDSDTNVDGAIIRGGNGIDKSDDLGGDGGNAIVVYKSTKQNVININSGFVCGGSGGKGVGNDTPDVGAAISYNGIYQGGTKVGRGLKGKKGGGNGGIAIKILSQDFDLDKLSFKPMTICEGSAGFSINKSENINNESMQLFGDADEYVSRHYFSLYDLDGKNYLTSLKNQADFGLCAVYAMCAQIETYLMMEFPEFVRDVCHKVTETAARTFPSRSNEINVSEVYFGMAQNKTPTDAFGNAGHSDAGNTDGWTWGTSTQTQVALASTWRGLVFEDDSISDRVYPRPSNVTNLANNPASQTFVDSYANKTAVHAKNMRIYDGLDYLDDDNNFDESRLLSDLKKAIVKNHGVYFGIFLDSGMYDMLYVSSTGVNYGNVTMFTNYDTMSGTSGHGMFIIGWDDDYEYKINSRAKPSGEKDKGVFILKNSWDEFSLIPQTRIMNWVSKKTGGGSAYVLSSDFMTGEYMPAFTQYENNYFYDTGVSGVSMNSKISVSNRTLSSNIKADVDIKYKKLLNVFKIRNDKEKAVAASFYGNLNNKQYEVALYRVPNDSNVGQIYSAINNESNKLTSKTFTNYHGVNVIDFDTPVDLMAGTYVAVVITSDEDNMGRTWIDGEGMEEVDISCTFHHTTDAKQKSFLACPTVNFKNIYKDGVLVEGDEFNTIKDTYKDSLASDMSCYKITNANLRIKLWTNNYVTIDTGTDGNIGGNNVAYYYPRLKASMSDIPTPTVTNTNKKFVGYNTKADGTGKSYDKNSIYSLDIADYLTLYAQYENKEQPTEPSTDPSTSGSTAPTEPSTSGSVAPTEPSTAPSTAPTTARVQETTTTSKSGGSSPGGGGGGGGGSRSSIPAKIVPPEVQGAGGGGGSVSKVQSKSNDIKINTIHSSATSWGKDATTNKWKLTVSSAGRGNSQAPTGFYIISRNVDATLTVSDTYYIDNSGNMLTGWLNTADDKWYFFDNTNTSNEGKMALGWKKIQNEWYYFTSNGSMLVNGTTPDGYKVGTDGKFKQ